MDEERDRMAGRWKWIVLVVMPLVALYLGRHACLRGLGEFLVDADRPQKADVAVVLAGDGNGLRILKGAELARQDWVKQVLVTGPPGYYDTNEAEMAIDFAVRRGAPRGIFVPLVMRVKSTIAEGRMVDAELERRKVTKALVVTSDYHTRRARSVFGSVGSGKVEYRFVAASDEDFRPNNWWQTREGRKVLFLEYQKLLYWWLIE